MRCVFLFETGERLPRFSGFGGRELQSQRMLQRLARECVLSHACVGKTEMIAIDQIRLDWEVSVPRCYTRHASEHDGHVYHDVRAFVVNNCASVDDAAAVPGRQRHETALDDGVKRLHLLLPSGRQLPGARVFLLEARRQGAITRRVVFANDSNVFRRKHHVNRAGQLAAARTSPLRVDHDDACGQHQDN